MKKLLILSLILAMCSAAHAVVFSDNFDQPCDADWNIFNYQGWYMASLGQPYPGSGNWSIGGWDGYQSLPDPSSGISATIVATPIQNSFNNDMGQIPPEIWMPWTEPDAELFNGVLRVMSSGGFWVDGLNTGTFLYKNNVGDFKAEVEIVAQNNIWNNCGGLMVRAANPDGAGANENWVYLSYFPVYGVGNHSRNTVNGSSVEMGITWAPPDPYLRLSRVGTRIFLETSPDGITYTSLPGLEAGIDRPDLPAELQVGIWQANYAPDWVSMMDFDNFSLVPEPATIALLGLGAIALIRRKR